MKLEPGKIYNIVHSRKGCFVGRVESDSGEFVIVTLMQSGMVKGLTTEWHSGEEIEIRKSLATFDTERAE